MAIKGMECEEFGDYLLALGLHEDVVSNIVGNRIDGQLFISLSEGEIKELAPAIGDRIRLRKILDEEQTKQTDNVESFSNGLKESQRAVVGTEEHAGVLASSLPSTSTSSNVSTTSSLTNPVPAQSDWHLTFIIPEVQTFSDYVKEAVSTGVISSRARREIIQVLRTYMTAYTVKPKSEQYKAVCKKLILKFPKLEDTEGKGDYGSWKLSLRNAFKNFRRNYKKRTTQESSMELLPPSKRMKLQLNIEDELDISEEEYEEAVKQMQQEYKKKSAKGKQGRSNSTVKHLMNKTRFQRLKWIQDEHPLVSEVLKKFPFLKANRWIRQEFQAIVSHEGRVGKLMDAWEGWCEKIIEMSKLESSTRPYLKKVLLSLDQCDKLHNPCDGHDAICLELLARLLYPRGLVKNAVFIKTVKDCDVDLDQQVAEVEQTAPFLLITGDPGCENSQIFICCENDILVESKTIRDALLDLLATYFTFDIAYPKGVSGILIFLQHFVLGLEDQQVVPTTTSKLISNLKKLKTD